MGTNYFTLNPRKHIGKTWANGLWCWACKVKAERDHIGRFSFCPNCGQRCSDRTMAFNPMLKECFGELPKSFERHGVDGALGFIWNTTSEFGVADGREAVQAKIKRLTGVKDEYGKRLTMPEFFDILKLCIEQVDSSGDFS